MPKVAEDAIDTLNELKICLKKGKSGKPIARQIPFAGK
jgi:hypothetical protein